jgi:hypothetical protein
VLEQQKAEGPPACLGSTPGEVFELAMSWIQDKAPEKISGVGP